MREDSGNYGSNGDFSVQVLEKALSMKGLDCTSLTNANFPEVFRTLHKQNAFICNKGSHWYTIRKVDDEWYDMNSFNDAPKFIPELILADELRTLLLDGLSIYLVIGVLPPPSKERNCSVDGKWIRIRGDEEGDLQAALELSMQKSSPPPQREESKSTSSSSSLYPSVQQIESKPLVLPSRTPILGSYPNISGSQIQSSSNLPTISNLSTSNLPTSRPLNTTSNIYSPSVPIGNENLTTEQQTIWMHQSFGRCLTMMERLNARLIAVESNIGNVRAKQSGNFSSLSSASPCVLLKNMFDPKVEKASNWVQVSRDYVCELCSQFGSVAHIYLDQHSEGFVYVKMDSVSSAQKLFNALHQRSFANRSIIVEYIAESIYYQRFPEAK